MWLRAISIGIAWLAFAFLTLTNPATSQSPIAGFPPGTFQSRAALDGGGFTASCTESSNFLARASGVTVTADKQAYDALICGLVTDGVFAKLDLFYVLVAPDATTARLNIVSSSFTATETATVTFTAYAGMAGNGTTGFEDTNFTPSTNGTNFTQNSAHMGVCVLTSSTSDNGTQFGSDNAVNNYIWVRPASGSFSYIINGGSFGNPVITNSLGFWLGVRTSAVSISAYKNGSNIDTTVSASSGLDNVKEYFFALNDAPAKQFSSYTFGAITLGGSLSAGDASNFHTRLDTYLTTYSLGSKC